MIATQ